MKGPGVIIEHIDGVTNTHCNSTATRQLRQFTVGVLDICCLVGPSLRDRYFGKVRYRTGRSWLLSCHDGRWGGGLHLSTHCLLSLSFLC